MKLYYLRNKYNLTQNELAQKLNLPRYKISDWEQGRSEPSINDIKNICNFFNVSIDFLLEYENKSEFDFYYSNDKTIIDFLKKH